jgi:NRAMP (natural resistance-associated macrophage protein)-like metal ion transporter
LNNRIKLSRRTLLALFAVLGPGFVTASAGNDVGGIATYSAAGAQFGYATLWSLFGLTLSLIVVQEMAGRMGAVTGQGLAGLIRENFGLPITFVTMLGLFLVNTGITATEFAGIAAASELFGVSRYIAIPASMLLVFFLVLRLPNKLVERVFVVLSLIYLTYVVSGILAHPDWGEVTRDSLVPRVVHDPAFLVTVVGLIGTTISPYMQFFLQAQVVDKGSRARDLPLIRVDIIVGSLLAIVLAGFIIIANGATIYQATLHGAHPININANPQAVDFARALEPLAGKSAETLFALGILNAGVFTAAVLPLSTAYIVCEAFGLEASLDRRFREAPFFYSLFGGSIILGAALVLLVPKESLFKLIIYAQVIQGVLLPLELVLMLMIINRPRVMGTYVNSRWFNVVGWATTIVIGTLALVYVWQSLTGA